MTMRMIGRGLGLAALAAIPLGTYVARPAKPAVVVNTEPNPVPVVQVDNVSSLPAQIQLRGLFQEGNIHLGDTILGPRSYTVPEGYSLLIRYATCEAVRGVGEIRQFDLSLDADFDFDFDFGSRATRGAAGHRCC